MHIRIKPYFFCAFLMHITAFSLSAMKTEAMLDNLNIVTFIPQPSDRTSNNSGQYSFEQVATALKEGKRHELDGKILHIPGSNNRILLSSSLPSNHTGMVYLNVPPLMCSSDKHTYPTRGAYEMYGFFKSGVIAQGVGVSYCPPHHKRTTFNFGQEDDQRTISTIIESIVDRNPESRVTLLGICAGATGILNTLAGQKLSDRAKGHVAAAILQSPALSPDRVWQDMGRSYLPHRLQWLFPRLAPLYFPRCKAEKSQTDLLRSFATNIPPHIRFMIGKLAKDPVTPAESVAEIETALSVRHAPVTVFTCRDPKIKHGFLAPDKTYQQAIKKFLVQHNFDHKPDNPVQYSEYGKWYSSLLRRLTTQSTASSSSTERQQS